MTYILMALFAAGIVALDQWTKALTVAAIPLYGHIPALDGLFRFSYVQNTGAAFSSFRGQQWLFALIFAVFTVMLLWELRRKSLGLKPFEYWCVTAIWAGGLGNMIDRVRLGYVVDMIELEFMSFPVFNVADSLPSADTLFTQRGLTVTNPVLKGYEYTKITVSNMSGEEVEYHYEDFTGQPQFAYTLSLDAGYPVQIMYPINYKYGASSIEQMYAMKQTNPPQASLSSDNYAIWQAQNRNSIQASLDASKLTLANAQEVRSKTGGIASALDNLFDSAKSGITDMLGSMGMALPEGASDALTTAGYSGLNSLLSMGFLQSFGLEASYVYDQQVNVAMQGLRNVEASFKDQSYLPPSAHGSNAYGDLLLMNQFGFMIIITAPDAANLAKLDLDMVNEHLRASVTTK